MTLSERAKDIQQRTRTLSNKNPLTHRHDFVKLALDQAALQVDLAAALERITPFQDEGAN